MFRVKMGPGGMEALIRLGAGDMRRTLNILQVVVFPPMCSY
jgi:DNA polymerase III delta prime subunit